VSGRWVVCHVIPPSHATSSAQTKRGEEGERRGGRFFGLLWKKGGYITHGPTEHEKGFRMMPPPSPMLLPSAVTRRGGV
jgi:hypothetical protein